MTEEIDIFSWDYFSNISMENVRIDGQFINGVIANISFKRDGNHNLELAVESPVRLLVGNIDRKPGEVYINDSVIVITADRFTVVLQGVAEKKCSEDLSQGRPTSFSSTFDVQSISVNRVEFAEDVVERCIDYIANLPTRYIWPNAYTEECVDGISARTYRGNEDVILRYGGHGFMVSRSSMMILIGGYKIIVGCFDSKKAVVPGAGYVIYCGNPSEYERARIRQSISFAFGASLVYYSSALLNCRDKVIMGSSKTAQCANGAFFNAIALPPAPITVDMGGGLTNLLDSNKFQRLSQGVYDFHNKCNLDSLLWRLQYSEVAPYFMKPAYYGSLLERLQNDYINVSGGRLGRALINKSEYKLIRNLLVRHLGRKKLSSDLQKIFINKINDGNVAPQKIIAARFFGMLGLILGDVELKAWQTRNDAAHGNEIEDGEEKSLFIRRTRILRMILIRVILKITNGSDEYYDYYTLGFKVRSLENPVDDFPTGEIIGAS